MHEKPSTLEYPSTSLRPIIPEDPLFLNDDPLENGETAVIGSLYLGDARRDNHRSELDQGGQRFEIVDLRSAPLDGEGYRMFDGQRFSNSIDYVVIQGQPDWKSGTGFKGIRSGESITLGRRDPITTRRFDLSNPEISRSHATLSNVEGMLVIEDNQSSNGTTYAAYERQGPQFEAMTTDQTTTPVSPEHTARTESNLARVMGWEEIAKWGFMMRETLDEQYGSVQELMERPELAPVTGVEIDGKTFLISEIMLSAGRKVAVGYVSGGVNPGRLMPRLFYQSMSDGGWRSSPNIAPDGVLSKGLEQLGIRESDEYGHYVQVTKPSEDLVAVLERQDRLQQERNDAQAGSSYNTFDYRELMDLYDKRRIEAEAHSTFADEVRVTKVEGRFMDSYIPGVGAHDGETLPEQLAAMELPAGFEPDFTTEPSKLYRTQHTLAGSTTIEVYPAQLEGRVVEWHVAHDETHNRVWIDRITYKDGEVTTYGTQSEVIVAGALSAKPFDYMEQLWGMRERRDWVRADRRYADVTPTLDRIPALARYRQARGIYRK